MMDRKSPPNQTIRDRVLSAAERLLEKEGAAFSMRELAAEAEVSFATPFNHFGSKGAIMLALSEQRIGLMQEALAKKRLPAGALPRVLVAVDIATSVMLDAPQVNRAAMGVIGSPSDPPGDVLSQSSTYWAHALGDGDGLGSKALALRILPELLAVTFRGVLSFWTAGEISDDTLVEQARGASAAVMAGFLKRDDKMNLLVRMSRFKV